MNRSKIFISVFGVTFLFLLHVCQNANAQPKSTPIVELGAVFNITDSSVMIPYSVTGDPSVTEQGVCFSLNKTITIADNKTIDFTVNGTGSDTITLSGLTAGKKYYIAGFASNPDTTVLSSGTPPTFTILATKPTSACGVVSASTLESTSVSLTWPVATGANRYGAFTIEGTTPVDLTLLQNGISAANQSNVAGLKVDVFGKNNYTQATLIPNTTYTTTVVSANSVAWPAVTINYYTSEVRTITYTTLKVAPTIQSSELVFSNITSGSVQISWTNGNGDGRIVKMNSSDSFINPSSGDYPTGNNTYVGGEQVVYNGSGSSVTVSGLSGNSTYYIRVYDYNNAAVGETLFNVSLSSNNPSSVTTSKNPPTTQDHSLVFSSVGLASMTVSWSKGDGEGRIVVMNDVDTYISPEDKTDYPADNSWKSNGAQVVYNGTGSSVTVNSLTSGVNYYFKVFAYNDLPEKSVYCTLTGSDNPKSQKTIGGAPSAQDHSFLFSNISENSVVVDWTKGNGDFSLVSVNTENTFASLVQSYLYTTDPAWQGLDEQYVYSSNGSQVTVTGLSAGTKYYFRVRGYNNELSPAYNVSEAASNPSSMITNASVPTQQDHSLGFSSVGNESITLNWTSGNGNGHLIKMNTTNSFSDPIINTFEEINSAWTNLGEQSIYFGTGNSATVTNLDSLTTYYFRAYACNTLESVVSYNIETATDNPKSQSSGGTVQWIGSISSEWQNSGNWVQEIVPGLGNDVIIVDAGGSDYPILTQNVSVKSLTIQEGGQLTVETGIALSVSGNLDLLGTISGSGSLVEQGTGVVSVSGTSSFQLHTGITSDWHLASIPTSNTNINQFNGNYVNRWNEETSDWTQMTASHPLEVMRGYSIKYYNQNMVKFTGTFNTGSKAIGVTSANPGNEDYGWNMIGNPYPSAIDWSATSGWTRTNIDNTVYKYDASQGMYVTYNHLTEIGVPGGTTGIIPAGNGYWVLSNTASATLSHTNDIRVHSSESFNKSQEKTGHRILRLTISNGSKSDEMVILLHPDAGVNFNSGIDAYKFFAYIQDVPQIYAMSNSHDHKLVVASINENKFDNMPYDEFIEIPIGYANYINKTISISVNENSISDNCLVYLYDTIHNKEYDLGSVFSGTNEIGVFNDRYKIRIGKRSKPLGVNNTLTTNSVEIFSVKNMVFVESNSLMVGDIKIYDVNGRVVYRSAINNVVEFITDPVNKSGIFVVVVNLNDRMYTKKVFVE